MKYRCNSFIVPHILQFMFIFYAFFNSVENYVIISCTKRHLGLAQFGSAHAWGA